MQLYMDKKKRRKKLIKLLYNYWRHDFQQEKLQWLVCCLVNNSKLRLHSLNKKTSKTLPCAAKVKLHLIVMLECRGLVDKGTGLVMKFRVRIPKRSVVVLRRASNLKILLCYMGALQCCQHCRVPFHNPYREKTVLENRGSKNNW